MSYAPGYTVCHLYSLPGAYTSRGGGAAMISSLPRGLCRSTAGTLTRAMSIPTRIWTISIDFYLDGGWRWRGHEKICRYWRWQMITLRRRPKRQPDPNRQSTKHKQGHKDLRQIGGGWGCGKKRRGKDLCAGRMDVGPLDYAELELPEHASSHIFRVLLHTRCKSALGRVSTLVRSASSNLPWDLKQATVT